MLVKRQYLEAHARVALVLVTAAAAAAVLLLHAGIQVQIAREPLSMRVILLGSGRRRRWVGVADGPRLARGAVA
jgi:hypothetical protein